MLKNQKFKVLLLLVLTALLSYQCSNEDENLIESNINIITVTDAEALGFLDNLRQNQSQSRSTSVPYVTIYDTHISNYEITNTDEVLTVLPAVLNNGEAYSRVALLNIDGEIKSIVYSMYSFNNFTTDNFFGEILITDLEGNFINRFKVEDGLMVSKYMSNEDSSQDDSAARSTNCDCPWECGYCELEEVVIIATPRPEIVDLFTTVAPEGADVGDEVGNPTGGGGGGSSGVGGNGNGFNDVNCGFDQILDADGDCVTTETDCGEGYTINE
ncbi:MAG: hypothetical protein HKP48_03075 [Winogradskyella sp.]|uniref:hypothetical protein n=1 Tax=Winogradskyella sp. TaxID=1883156 RepID=UPI0017F013FB|nr:hypothetical protein [Winogradskyella sp.]MBT8245483.1 hypothetical protein [Winogradskyella sp.]NNK22290.1 hypothetical protein [Winogradskyella sp.]